MNIDISNYVNRAKQLAAAGDFESAGLLLQAAVALEIVHKQQVAAAKPMADPASPLANP